MKGLSRENLLILLLILGFVGYLALRSGSRKTATKPKTKVSEVAPPASSNPAPPELASPPVPRAPEFNLPPGKLANFKVDRVLPEVEVRVLPEFPPGYLGVKYGESIMVAPVSKLRGMRCNLDKEVRDCVLFPNGQQVVAGQELKAKLPPVLFYYFK